MINSVTLGQGHLQLQLNPDPIAAALGVSRDALAQPLLSFVEPFALRRRGVETRIIAGETNPFPDKVLQRTLAQAHLWVRSLRAGKSLSEIAASAGHSEPYLRTRIALAFLAPKLQAAILDGRQPPHLSLARLLREGIPMDWSEQERMFAAG